MTESEMTKFLADSETSLEPPARRLWQLIRTPPVRWQLPPWGDAFGGFWVVGFFGQSVVWYNEIEEGFNCSQFENRGVIGNYFCNQDDVFHTMNALLSWIEVGTTLTKLGAPVAGLVT